MALDFSKAKPDSRNNRTIGLQIVRGNDGQLGTWYPSVKWM
jgi:hypothetical protein